MIALYPGTFDPMTNGHLDIIQRGATLCTRVIVAVAKGTHKHPQLDWTARFNLCRDVVAPIENVQVVQFDGLTVALAKQHGANCILRGLRHAGDFEYEAELAGMNAVLSPGMETLFLLAAPSHRSLSASVVRDIAAKGGDIRAFVPKQVADVLS